MLLPMRLPPGVFANGTQYQAKGRWLDANLVRFLEGTIRPVGGWAQMPVEMSPTDSLVAITGTCRTLLAWQVQGATSPHLAIGTEETIVVFTAGDVNDLTPAGLTAGNPDTTTGVGQYGSGNYGFGDYGVGDSTQGSETEASLWHLDNFGSYLVGVLSPSDGVLYSWDAAADTMAAVAGAPSCTSVVVTPERFVVALGAGGNPRNIQWSDLGNLTDWTIDDPAKQGGDFILQTNGKIVCGRRGRGETLIWTTSNLFSMRYIGGTLVYGFDQIGANCGIIGPNAVAVVDGRAAWMGHKNFFVYDGFVRPAPSEVSDHVFSDFNRIQKVKCFAVSMSDAGEIWFFYPSSTSEEPDKYVIWNYREDHWTPGELTRTAGIDRGVFPYPVMAGLAPSSESGTTYLYEHEKGFDHDGADTPYLESGPVELGEGDQTFDITELVPDESTQAGQALGNLRVTLYGSLYPTASVRTFGPFTLRNPTTFRASARQMRMRVEEVVAGDWRMGILRLNAQPGSRR